MQDDVVERLNTLHVWPQSVADHHADILTARQVKQLYDIGTVATEAAATILSLREQLEKAAGALRDVFEEWAGSEGFIPETAPEGYLLQLTKRMADIAAAGLGATYAELAK